MLAVCDCDVYICKLPVKWFDNCNKLLNKLPALLSCMYIKIGM